MISRRTALALLLAGGALAGAAFSARLTTPAAAAPEVARLITSPSGGTFQVGQQAQFTARALSANGTPIPGVSFTWSTNRSAVFQISGTGLGTAAGNGTATLTVRGGGKSLKVPVTVAAPGPPPVLLAGGLSQVNHLIADNDWLYWTEVDKKVVRVRKMAKTGGPIYDLASEPYRNGKGLRLSYVHLRQTADTLYFSRQTLGFLDHWSIRSVPKTGGPVQELLAEDIALEPLDSAGWVLSGSHLVVALFHPEKLGLADNVEVAALNLNTGTWSPMVSGLFEDRSIYITAADDSAAYVRGFTPNGDHRLLRAVPGQPENSYTQLLANSGTDGGAKQHGATDGVNLYFWSERGGDKLQSIPVGGGAVQTILTNLRGFGLAADGEILAYVTANRQLFQVPVTGGTPVRLMTKVAGVAILGGLALDTDSAFVPRSESGGRTSIREVAR